MSDTKQRNDMKPQRENDASDAARTAEQNRGGEIGVFSAAHEKKKSQSTPDSSYQNYLFGKAGSDEHPAWSDSTSGRAAIRLISRGIVGAAFFTIGGRLARSQLTGYNEHHWEWDSSKPLQAVAKGIDYTLGRGIKAAVKGFASFKHGPEQAEEIAKNAVKFRQKRPFEYIDKDGKLQSEMGRSYGADIVSFTTDFAMASVGDALTRNVIQAFDPNVKKSWLVNDAGDPAARGEKKHFVVKEAAKSLLNSSWRILTKNQGEDWAAAIPYAFQMKFQRQFLSSIFNKRFDGHKLVFDHNWNGGAYKVGPKMMADGTMKDVIIGDYQLVGALDLHLRFVGYNWYTLMFREGYDTVGNALKKWKDDGFAIHAPQLPENFNPITTPIDAVAHAARYVTKSFIKANMYMNPAVIPFWVMRVSQSKWRPDKFVHESAIGGPLRLEGNTNVFRDHVPENEHKLFPHDTANYKHYPTDTVFDRFEKRFSKGMNWFGEKQFNVGQKVADVVVGEKIGDVVKKRGWFPRSKWLDNLVSYDMKSHFTDFEKRVGNGQRNFMHEYMDASFAYTPYMFAKAEMGLRVDDTKGNGELGEMDKAIYRFMDNVGSFRIKDAGSSLKEMWKLGTHFERTVPVREGGLVATPAPSNASQKAPQTKVVAATVQHQTSQPIAAHNDNEHSANDNDHDKSWVQSIVGRDINPAHIHAANATRH